MDDDLSAVAASRREPIGLDGLSAPRRRTVDEHMFSALVTSGQSSTCRLQLFTADGARPVVVVTQVMGEGMSLTNAVEAFAAAAWERYCPQEVLPPVWVQRLLGSEGEALPTGFQVVRFTEGQPYRPQNPRWSAITVEQLKELVGTRVEEGCGDGYVPRPEEPEPDLVFEEFTVVRLARPRPFRKPECMPVGVTWWRRWARQAWPRRGARGCCWYHGGDWHEVSAMALDVLKQARAQPVAPQDMEQYAVAHADAAGASRWQVEALATLFNVADAIQPSRNPGYINGQHRAQALLDAGVRRTVVLRMVWAQ
ncbi:hypothetical protein [Streptomyces sp. NBC_00989]|uniref:hypothetical protein n=1 Tax=Streptomyces sp. NBC_00989 TaxID=2903705 RepID=UPI002F9178CC|nr:hypothetical protein OG714_54350 [Streptomyces sp. NBC_00989]